MTPTERARKLCDASDHSDFHAIVQAITKAVDKEREKQTGIADLRVEAEATLGEVAVRAIKKRCVKEINQKAEYYNAIAKRDNRSDMAEHALTCTDLARVIEELK